MLEGRGRFDGALQCLADAAELAQSLGAFLATPEVSLGRSELGQTEPTIEQRFYEPRPVTGHVLHLILRRTRSRRSARASCNRRHTVPAGTSSALAASTPESPPRSTSRMTSRCS